MRVSRRTFAGGAASAAMLGLSASARPAAPLSSGAAQADFDELFERLARAHFDLFANRSHNAHVAEHSRLRHALGPGTSRDEALRIYQRFVAFGRVAHARIDGAADAFGAYRKAGGRIFPLTLRIKNGRAYVMANASGSAQVAAGDELLSIEGHSSLALLDSLWTDISADTAYMLHSMLEWELPRLLWQRFGSRRAFRLTVRTGDGPSRQLTLPALSSDSIAAARLEPAPLAIPLEERQHGMIGGDVAYLRPGPFYAVEQPDRPYDNRAFVAFIDAAFRAFLQQDARLLLLDLRDNPGGDNSFSDHMVSWFADRPFRFASAFQIRVSPEAVASNKARLAVPGNDPTGTSALLERAYANARQAGFVDFPIVHAQPRSTERFGGTVFVLVNRHTYSNAVNVAALIQDYGFGTVLGEETSDLATTLGAMEQFTLSRTGIIVGFPKARIVRPSGVLRARGVVPDSAIDTPVVETGDDPVLQSALALVRRAASP
jgi:hypothetical protein